VPMVLLSSSKMVSYPDPATIAFICTNILSSGAGEEDLYD
jgi:hypothetical protein